MSENTEYSSGYLTAAGNLPTSWQPGWVTVDAALRVGRLDGPWEAALIGRNLTNKFYTELGYDPWTTIPGTPADNFAFVNRSRQVMLQFTFRPHWL